MFNCVSFSFPCGILGQVWYLILLIPDLCRLSYFQFQKFIFSACVRNMLENMAFVIGMMNYVSYQFVLSGIDSRSPLE